MVYTKVILITDGDNCFTSGRIVSKCSKKHKEQCNLNVIYAGLIFFSVQIMMSCAQEGSRHLTFSEIYNNTNYVHIPNFTKLFEYFPPVSPKPNDQSAGDKKLNKAPTKHNVPQEEYNMSQEKYNISQEDIKGNELEYEEYDSALDFGGYKKQLLVALSHDPFRFSVTEEDYLKGVRIMNATEYMNKKENRGKRGVLHLYNMVSCATGCNPVSYVGYGCYCGFQGDGRPTDGIDECCRIHDRCYDNFRCPFHTVYFQPYLWSCSEGRALCAIENYRTQHQFINGCAAQLCECDRRFAMCIRRYRCPRKRALCVSSPLRLLQNLLFG